MKLSKLILLFMCISSPVLSGELNFTFNSPAEGTLRLEAFEYLPKKWNGKVILMSHGSTGGHKDAIKTSLKFLNISKEATENGYIFVSFMRKGRGSSEGIFTEETGRCDEISLKNEMAEAESQLAQVVNLS